MGVALLQSVKDGFPALPLRREPGGRPESSPHPRMDTEQFQRRGQVALRRRQQPVHAGRHVLLTPWQS